MLTNNETVSFSSGLVGNVARFSYFGDAAALPALRGKTNITVSANGLSCYYDMRVQSAKKMYWELIATETALFSEPKANEQCPPSSAGICLSAIDGGTSRSKTKLIAVDLPTPWSPTKARL